MDPLTPEEVKALEVRCSLETQRLIATIRDRERERDELQRKLDELERK